MRIRATMFLLAVALGAGVSWLLYASQKRSIEQSPRAIRSDAKQPAESPASRSVVLELFTSQGCSSCPPADRLLSTLGEESFDQAVVIPLAWHVDYWNYIGWSDPFSSSAFSARQQEYARAMKAAQVYTPQLVLDGKNQLVGSSERAVRAEIARQLNEADRAMVSIGSFDPSTTEIAVDVSVSLSTDVSAGKLGLRVVLFENDIRTTVKRGENSGKTLRNDHVVRWASPHYPVQKIPNESVYTVGIPVEEEWQRQNLGVAVFVQDSETLEILGAAARAPANHR